MKGIKINKTPVNCIFWLCSEMPSKTTQHIKGKNIAFHTKNMISKSVKNLNVIW